MERRQGWRDGLDIGLAQLYAMPQQPQRAKQAPATRVCGKLPQEWLRLDNAVQQRAEGFDVEEQQPLTRPERAGVRLAHLTEMGGIGLQRLAQAGRGRLGFLGGLGVDHRDHQVIELRKVAVEDERGLAPGQAFGKHQVGVGADAQMRRGEPRTETGEQHARADHQACVALSLPDNSDEHIQEKHG